MSPRTSTPSKRATVSFNSINLFDIKLYLILFNRFSDAEMPTPEEDLHEMQQTLEKEKERLQIIRMQLAKKNRAIVSIERKLDNIPDRTELSQYQRRFIELYSQGTFQNHINLIDS